VLKIGERAPDFTAATAAGHELTLSSLRGHKKVVLYFYPKAFTPGCTAETQSFRDNYEDLKALGAEVIGVSTDDLETQCKFAEENRVTFPMVSDPGGEISRAFGVLWPVVAVDKRVTFILDEYLVVRAVYRHEMQVMKHLDDVINFLKRLKK
jgi:peroxiredoxin Q/BCP